MTGFLRAIINNLPAGQKYVKSAYQYLDGSIKDVISYLQFTRSTEKGKKTGTGRVFIIFYPLIGTTGWTVAEKVIENLGESKMVILVYESDKEGIMEQLKYAINDATFKIEESYKTLGKVVRESPIFIIRNQSNDSFDQGILTTTLEVLNSCAKASFGSDDMIKMLDRQEISRIQFLVPAPNINVDTISEEGESIKKLNLAEIVEPEVLFATANVGEGALRMLNRTLVCGGPERFAIISFGLYKIKDEFLKELLKREAQLLIDKIKDPELIEKIRNLKPEVLKQLEQFEVGKKLIKVIRTLYGTPMPKKEEKGPQKDTSEYDKILENLAEIINKYSK